VLNTIRINLSYFCSITLILLSIRLQWACKRTFFQKKFFHLINALHVGNDIFPFFSPPKVPGRDLNHPKGQIVSGMDALTTELCHMTQRLCFKQKSRASEAHRYTVET